MFDGARVVSHGGFHAPGPFPVGSAATLAETVSLPLPAARSRVPEQSSFNFPLVFTHPRGQARRKPD